MSTPQPTEGAPTGTSPLDGFAGIPRLQVRLAHEAMHTKGPRIQACSPADVGALLKDYYAERSVEEFLSIHLNAANYVTNVVVISRGGLSASIVEPRAIFQAAILSNAAAIVLAHNHPSGNPEPSKEDLRITSQLTKAGKLMGIPIHDHIIVAGERFTSLAERGYMGGLGLSEEEE